MRLLGHAKAALETLSSVLVVIAASGLIWTIFFKSNSSRASTLPSQIETVTGTIASAHLTNRMGDGPLAIIEFTDFQCPFCARHSKSTLPSLKRALVDSGKARYIVVNLPLPMHARAVEAAEAAECAGEQGKYWEMHEALFARQAELTTVTTFADYVRGLDTSRFDECVRSDRLLTRVTAHQAEATRLGLNSTPTMFIGRVRSDGGIDLLRRVNGAVPAETFIEEIARL